MRKTKTISKTAAEPPSTRRRPAELRSLLLEAAGKVFSRNGYADTTMESISVEAGVAPSVMYRHFPTKPELFRGAVLLPFFQFLQDYRATWSGQLRAPWDEHRLMCAMLGEFYDRFRSHRHGVLVIASINATLDRDTARELQKQLDAVFAEVLKIGEHESVQRGWIPRERLELSIRMVLGMVAAAAVLDPLFLPTGRRRPSRDQIIDHLASLALYGLRLHPANEEI